MHDAALKPRRARRSKRPPLPLDRLAPLFDRLRFLRAASSESLHTLVFEQVFPGACIRTTTRMLARLVEEKYLARLVLDQKRIVYHLTRRSLGTFTTRGIAASDYLRRPPTREVGGALWLRSLMHAAARKEGYLVARDPLALHAARKFLMAVQQVRIDHGPKDKRLNAASALAQFRSYTRKKLPLRPHCEKCSYEGACRATETICPRCRGPLVETVPKALFQCVTCAAFVGEPGRHVGPSGPCAGLVRDAPVLSVDVAWRWRDQAWDVFMLFVDTPYVNAEKELDGVEMLHFSDMPPMPFVLRSCDPDSLYQRSTSRWLYRGLRHRQLIHAFTSKDQEPRNMPWMQLWATVKEFREDIQLHVVP